MRRVTITGAVLLLIGLLGGCGEATPTPTPAPEDYRSGLITFLWPGEIVEIDFSALPPGEHIGTDFGMAAPPAPAEIDLRFTGFTAEGGFEAPYGLVDLGERGAWVAALEMTPPPSEWLEAPADGYADRAEFWPSYHLYVVRTAEGDFVLFYNAQNYIGGFDRYTFFWSYAPGGSHVLWLPAEIPGLEPPVGG